MGGSSTTVTPNAQPGPAVDYNGIPGYGALEGEATNQMSVFGPFGQAGAGYQMQPKDLLGQVQVAGPNNTSFGTSQDGSLTSSPYSQPAGNSGGKGGAGPVAGGSNVPASQTGNTGLGSVLNSLEGLLGNTGVPSGFLQGLTGGQQTGGTQNTTGTQSPYSNLGAQTGQQQQTQPQGAQTALTGAQTPVSGGNQGSATAAVGSAPASTTQVGQHIPNTVDSTYAQTPTSVPQATSNSFLGTNQTAPYYNQAAVAGNLGTSSGQAVGSAGNFMNSLYSPGLSQMSQDYLQAGAANAGQNLAQGINQLQSQYQTDPFNNQLGNAEANLMSQTANNTLQTASGMGIQQQQIAANQMSTPYNLTEQAAAVPVSAAQGLFNTANTAYNQYSAEPLAVLGQTPVPSPLVGSTTTSTSSLF